MKVYCLCWFYKDTGLKEGKEKSDGAKGVKEQICNSLDNTCSTTVGAWIRQE